MNPHVVIVHFPIAFLTVYSVLELLRFRQLMEKIYWFYVKAVLVIVGSLGAAAALLTGDIAAELVRGDRSLRQALILHETFADITTVIFAVVAVSYLVLWLNREFALSLFSKEGDGGSLKTVWMWLSRIAGFFVETKFVIILALTGLISITITGGLGGAMVFGPKADPLFKPVYNLLLGK